MKTSPSIDRWFAKLGHFFNKNCFCKRRASKLPAQGAAISLNPSSVNQLLAGDSLDVATETSLLWHPSYSEALSQS